MFYNGLWKWEWIDASCAFPRTDRDKSGLALYLSDHIEAETESQQYRNNNTSSGGEEEQKKGNDSNVFLKKKTYIIKLEAVRVSPWRAK